MATNPLYNWIGRKHCNDTTSTACQSNPIQSRGRNRVKPSATDVTVYAMPQVFCGRPYFWFYFVAVVGSELVQRQAECGEQKRAVALLPRIYCQFLLLIYWCRPCKMSPIKLYWQLTPKSPLIYMAVGMRRIHTHRVCQLIPSKDDDWLSPFERGSNTFGFVDILLHFRYHVCQRIW